MKRGLSSLTSSCLRLGSLNSLMKKQKIAFCVAGYLEKRDEFLRPRYGDYGFS